MSGVGPVLQISRFFLSLFGIVLVIFLGTLGYVYLEGWSWFDSLYMTVITLTTVGFQEVHPMSTGGRAFTIVLIFVGVGVVMLVLTTFARLFLEQQIRWIFERRSMQQEIDKLSGHTIFCGFGRLSQHAVTELADTTIPIVIIDKDPSRLELAEQYGHLAVEGDASEDETLIAAGVERARRVVCLLPTDSANLYTILTCREINPKLFIISRTEDVAGEKRIKRAGADRIISPYRVGGLKIADGLRRPHVTEFLDIAASAGGSDLFIEEILIPIDSPVIGKSLSELEIRRETNITVAALISADGRMKGNPSGDTVIEGGATLIGLGCKDEFLLLEKLLFGEADSESDS